MKVVILDGGRMTSEESTHQYISSMLDFPEHYGGNLDALWDILSTISESTKIKLINEDKLIFNLGDYAMSLLSVIKEATEENEKIHFEII